MRVAVVSDTHGPRFWKSCPPAVAAHLRTVDRILHAGDVCNVGVLDELQRFAPVDVVLGNNDGPDVAAWGAAVTRDLELDGLRVSMIHDSGTARGRHVRLRAMFPDAELIVFGHSHIPWNEVEHCVRFFNPGSPTDRRRQTRGTMGMLEIVDGVLTSATIVPVTEARA